MTTNSPPPYLSASFDPAKSKVAELRGILLEHDVPFASNAKKPELVSLFKKHIKPKVPRLLKELKAVRASDDGVLDGESLSGSLKELDTDFEQEQREEEEGDGEGAKKKKGKKVKSKRKSTVTRAQAEAEEDERVQEEEELEKVKKKKKSRKSVRVTSPEVEQDYEEPVEFDEVVPLADEPSLVSPKKRKASGQPEDSTPRTSSLLKARRRTIQYESGGEGGFSDYNPFQSGGEETPARDLKRRKSSLGPERLKEKKSFTSEDPPQANPSSSTTTSRSPRKSAPANISASTPSTSSSSSSKPFVAVPPASIATRRPELTTSGSWSSSTPEQARQRLLDPDSARKPSTSTSTSTPKVGTSSASSLKGTPVGVKYMIPVEKINSAEKEKRIREYEELRRREEVEKREREEREREEAELRQLEEEVAMSPEEAEEEVVPQEEEDEEMDSIEDQLEQEMEVDEAELEYDEDEPFDDDDGLVEDHYEPIKEVYEPVPPRAPVIASLRNERISTPRRSEPIPYSPRQALAQAGTPRRSFPLPTPPASSTKSRQLVGTGRAPSSFQSEQAIAIRPNKPSSHSLETTKRVSGWTLALLALIYTLWWREEKLAVGFCDTNTHSNSLVESRSTSLALPSLPPVLVSTLDTLHLRPTCTPCPAHGHCENGAFVGCTLDYVPRASPLRLGGLIPIAPSCVPDTEKLMVVAMQASKASKLLRKRRGEVVCGGLERMRRKQIGSSGGVGDKDALVYGLQADNVLSALMRENEASKSPFSEEILEELNRLALNDLVNHGEVLTFQDGDDYWYASKTAEMSLSCQARLAVIRSVKRHKTGLGGVFSTLLSLLYLRYKLQARVQEKQKVAELVQTALVQLQRQERSHHADPVLVPFPHIAPSHLRDLVLQHVHSPIRRAHLWKKVEKVVEGNSNVRVMEVEQNGEELRGWKWVGATSSSSTTTGQGQIEPPAAVERPTMTQSGNRVLKAAL